MKNKSKKKNMLGEFKNNKILIQKMMIKLKKLLKKGKKTKKIDKYSQILLNIIQIYIIL